MRWHGICFTPISCSRVGDRTRGCWSRTSARTTRCSSREVWWCLPSPTEKARRQQPCDARWLPRFPQGSQTPTVWRPLTVVGLKDAAVQWRLHLESHLPSAAQFTRTGPAKLPRLLLPPPALHHHQLSQKKRRRLHSSVADMALIDKVPGDLKLYIGGYVVTRPFTKSICIASCNLPPAIG